MIREYSKINRTERTEKGAILHVGANTYNPGKVGPIFSDGTFRYVLIMDDTCPDCPTYRELGLERFVPRGKEDRHVHYDPEFETNTYGDWTGKTRTSHLTKLVIGDFIFFLSSLKHYKTGKRLDWVDPDWAYYLISFFKIEEILRDVRLTPKIRERFGNNAHVKRGDSGFNLYRGTSDSRLLKCAIPMSSRRGPNDFARKILKNLNPKDSWCWQREIIEGDRLEILLSKIEDSGKFERSEGKRIRTLNDVIPKTKKKRKKKRRRVA